MIDKANEIHTGDHLHFSNEIDNSVGYDYALASGIFNLRFETDDKAWKEYILKTLDLLNQHSTKGYAFNMLSMYSDKEYQREDLYYGDPGFFMDYCCKNHSRNVVVFQDYKQYDFTICVMK